MLDQIVALLDVGHDLPRVTIWVFLYEGAAGLEEPDHAARRREANYSRWASRPFMTLLSGGLKGK